MYAPRRRYLPVSQLTALPLLSTKRAGDPDTPLLPHVLVTVFCLPSFFLPISAAAWRGPVHQKGSCDEVYQVRGVLLVFGLCAVSCESC